MNILVSQPKLGFLARRLTPLNGHMAGFQVHDTQKKLELRVSLMIVSPTVSSSQEQHSHADLDFIDTSLAETLME